MSRCYNPDEDWAELADDLEAQGHSSERADAIARACVAITLKKRKGTKHDRTAVRK